MLDRKTLAFADFRGNRQYITSGNLAENPKAHLFLIDYATRRRIKLWGEARVTDDPALLAALMPANYKGPPRTGDPVPRDRLGRQLPPAYPAVDPGR